MEMKTHFHNPHPEVALSFLSDLEGILGGGGEHKIRQNVNL